MKNLYLLGTETYKLADCDVDILCKALSTNTVFNGNLYLSDNSLTDQVLTLNERLGWTKHRPIIKGEQENKICYPCK